MTERLLDGEAIWWASPDGGATYHCYLPGVRTGKDLTEFIALCGRTAGTMTGESKHSPPRLRCPACVNISYDIGFERRACDVARANRLVRDLAEKVR